MPIHGLVRSPQRSKTIDVVRGRQLRRTYSLRAGSTTAAMVGSLPGLTSAPRFPHALQTKRGSRSESLTSSGHWSTTPRPRMTFVAGIVQAEDDETKNTSRIFALLSQALL